MEAINVNVYFLPNDKNKIGQRFYSIYLNREERLDLATFLNSAIDFDEFEKRDMIDKINGISKNGTIKEYNVILTFNNKKNNKDYIVYTNNLYDSDNKLKVFAAIYDIDSPDPFMGYPTSNEEWKDICELLDSVVLDNKGE